MAYDGNGNYIRPHNWTQDAANGIDINAPEMDSEDNGIAAALSICVTRDGQGKMSTDFLPNSDNTLSLGTVSRRWANLNGVPISQLPITAAAAGLIINPQTSAELAALVVPTAYQYQAWRGEDVRRIGAVGDGVTDCRTALFAANSIGSPLYFPPGTYKISSALTFTVPLIMDYGAILKPDAGIAITINAPINAGPWQIFNVSNAGAVITGAVRVPVYAEWFGADPTGVANSDIAVQGAVALVQASGGGVIQFLGASYKFAGGNVFNTTKTMKFLGAGNGVSGTGGGTLFTHTGNNICFNFQAAVPVPSWGAITLEGFDVEGPTTGTSAIFANFSDMWGSTLRRCYVNNYQQGTSIQLWNQQAWTEGFVIEDCMIRNFAAGINFKRTSGTGGTDSFYGFRTRNLQMVPGPGGSCFLLNSTATNNLTLYGAQIDVGFAFGFGGTRGFFVGEYSQFVQSTVNIVQDGIPIVDGSDDFTFFQNSSGAGDVNGGYINVDGKVRAQQGADFYSTSALGATANIGIQNEIVRPALNQARSAVAGHLNSPCIRVKGAAVSIGDTAQTINKILTFVNMQPGTKYRAYFHFFGPGVIVEAIYEINHVDTTLISPVTLVSGADTANAKCRTFGAAAPLAAGTGLCFDVVLNAATIGGSCSYTLELEML